MHLQIMSPHDQQLGFAKADAQFETKYQSSEEIYVY